jgi:hypothetical protein
MIPSAVKSQYSVTLADIARDRSAILNLWAQGFAYLQSAAAVRKLETQYLQNPAGTAMCFALLPESTQNFAGIQGLVPRRYANGEANLRAGLMADYVVDTAHRSLGPALELMRACINGGITNFDFLYGFPNRKAEAIFKRAGLLPLGQMAQYVKLVQSRDFLQKKIHKSCLTLVTAIVDFALRAFDWIRYSLHRDSYQWRELTRFDAPFDRFWKELQPQHKMIAERSHTMLSWRYPMPSEGYRIFAAFEHNSDNLAGYIVWSQRNHEIYVRDFLAKPTALGPLLQCFCWQMRQRSASRITLEFFGASQIAKALTKSGFRPRGNAPIFIFGQNEFATVNGEHWYMTHFDRDTD